MNRFIRRLWLVLAAEWVVIVVLIILIKAGV